MANLASRLGVPSVYLDVDSSTATVLCEVSVDHLPCFLHALAHVEEDHGAFNIPDNLPPAFGSESEGASA
jgi:hypothetical protein